MCKMLILRKMLAKKMKNESSYLHRQLCMQVSSFGKSGNNPHTYNCDELYMASPLEKKQRTGSVNYHTEYGLPCVVLWLLQDNEQISGRMSRGRGSKGSEG